MKVDFIHYFDWEQQHFRQLELVGGVGGLFYLPE